MPRSGLEFYLIYWALLCGLVYADKQESAWDKLKDDKELQTFLGTLEKYETTQNDVVFVLDESGSIGSEVYPQVIVFTELIARLLSVSSQDSRLAVITYATDVRIRVNDIEKPTWKNMCTFLKELAKIDDYAAGWTYTGDAMVTSKNILRKGRIGVNKIIVLLTDGQSNGGYSLSAISSELKNSGVIIFTVGVAEVTTSELLMVATSEKHIYEMKDFNLISALNAHLVNDTMEIKYDKVSDTSLCDSYCTDHTNCCDVNADCYCGTKTGKYECSCTAGFGGKSGYRGQCKACTIGTYKSKIGNSDCIQCPANSTTVNIGGTSIEDCVCVTGHVGNPAKGTPCKPIECNMLKAPEGGILYPENCGHTYGSKCSFKCSTGYCPYSCASTEGNDILPWHILPAEPRTCLESGKWSGEDFLCEKVTCPSLDYPIYGSHNCSSQTTDFSYGTVCHMTCDKGFTKEGSTYRACMADGKWTGEETACTALDCPPLKTNQDLRIKPKACGESTMKYQSTCIYYCAKGFTLTSYHKSADKNISLGVRHCLVNGSWSNSDEKLFCEDVEPPNLVCPPSVRKPADYGKATVTVSWTLPTVVDNVDSVFPEIIEPKNIRKPPHEFRIGPTKVVYEATDSSGNNNTCSFTVTVLDAQPPNVDSCPSDIIVQHTERTGKSVKWEEPQFSDNSGNVSLLSINRKNGEIFKWGPPSVVTYQVTDPYGNRANCSFSVKVKAHSCQYVEPPANGFLVCDKWTNGQLCSVMCKEGFAFPAEPESVYFCSQKMQKWTRVPGAPPNKKFLFPWPDCSESHVPNRINISVAVNYSVTDCDPKDLIKMKEEFIKTLKAKHPIFCPKNKGCEVKNVDVNCGNAPEDTNARLKRSIVDGGGFFPRIEAKFRHKHRHRHNKHRRDRRHHPLEKNPVVLITFDIEVTNITSIDVDKECQDCSDKATNLGVPFDHGVDILGSLEPVITDTVSEVYRLENPDSYGLKYNVVPLCDAGLVLQNNTCVNCPIGTYFNETMSTCKVCPAGYYQDVEASLSCKRCPEGTWSLTSRSKRIDDCKAPCKPGSFSATGFQPCKACPKGTFQDESSSTYCLPCSRPWTTAFTGASLSSHCVSACGIGSFSENGYFPCTLCPLGTYQPFSEQKLCYKCPLGTTTLVEGAHDLNYCQTIHFCEDLKPCLNGATCVDTDISYDCTCAPGFSGRNCGVNINDCTPDSCENNSTCVDGINQFTCVCKSGFHGPRCEFNIDDCQSSPCDYGGSCIDLVDDYICECQEGFSGKNCEVIIDDCASNPCLNGGICFDMQNDFRCCCSESFTGKTCNVTVISVSKCVNQPCANGGTCYEAFDNYSCSCPIGFSGLHCEKNIDDCTFDSCGNGGTCIDGVSNVTCVCSAFYFGERCENVAPSDFSLKFSSPVTYDYVLIQNTRQLFELTVSFFMRTDYVESNNRGTPISYSYYNNKTSSVVDNALTLYDTNRLILYIHGKAFHTGYSANSDSKWHHYTVTWESYTGSWSFYVDGEVILSGSELAKGEYFYPGIFVLGQEQDALGGSFSVLEAFVGELSEFNVWDYAFTSEEVTELSVLCGFVGNVIPWSSNLQYIQGNLEVTSGTDLCSDIGFCSWNQCNCQFNNNSGVCKQAGNSCNPNPCKNNQMCVQSGTFTTCACEAGYSGRLCEYDINECSSDNGNCSHECTNTIGSYFCSCPQYMVLEENGHTCRDNRFCIFDGKIFNDNEQWDSSCDVCTCVAGNITCKRKPCSNLTCEYGEEKVHLPGQCCEICISQEASCSVYSNGTIETFDLAQYTFHGNCQYTLVEDCVGGTFALHFVKENNTYAEKSLSLYVSCAKVAVSSSGLVTVNDLNVTLPYEDENVMIDVTEPVCNTTVVDSYIDPTVSFPDSSQDISVTSTDSGFIMDTYNISTSSDYLIDSSTSCNPKYNLVKVWTRHGVFIEWHYRGDIVVSLTENFRKKVCGLCGNFNTKPMDDTPNNSMLSGRTLSFMARWKSDDQCHEPTPKLFIPNDNQVAIREKAEELAQLLPWISLNCHLTEQFKMIANKVCSVFWSKQFDGCTEIVNPNVYHALCLKESCMCRDNSLCFCDTVLTYVMECGKRNITIDDLSSAEICREHCSNGMIYQECGSACHNSCSSLSAKKCPQKWHCTPGCYCPRGTVLHEGHCIPESDCLLVQNSVQ